jgi:hypothetical protein
MGRQVVAHGERSFQFARKQFEFCAASNASFRGRNQFDLEQSLFEMPHTSIRRRMK